MKFIPHKYQERAVQFLLDRPRAGLFADMGLGKTAIILSTLHDLMFDYCEIQKPLIIAPLQVAYNVWPDEIRKWDFCKDWSYHLIHNNGKQVPLPEKQLYITNYDSLPWFFQHAAHRGIDCVVLDESTFVKNHSTKRWQYVLAMFGAVERLYILTGTPSPNGLKDLWGQMYFLDEGKRLGVVQTDFNNNFFSRNPYSPHKFEPRKGAMDTIIKKISDITMTLRREDLGEIPDVDYIDIKVKLPKKIMEMYEKFETDFIIEVANQKVATFNIVSLATKLRQIAQGFLILDGETIEHIHDIKLNMLEDLVKSRPDENFIIGINFRHEAKMLLDRFPKARVIYGGTPIGARKKIIDMWNKGKLKMLIAHPASLGHGVNLQTGGKNLIWLGPPWNLEHWKQFNARIDRQGQKHKVCIFTLVAKGTKDVDVARALKQKDMTQQKLMKGLANANSGF